MCKCGRCCRHNYTQLKQGHPPNRIQRHSRQGAKTHISRCRAAGVCVVWTLHGCIPWAALWVGWRRGEAPPDSDCSGRPHRGQSAGCNVACPPTRRGGCSATGGYTSAWPAAVGEGDWVAGATENPASEGEGRRGREGSLNVKKQTLGVFPRRSGTGGRNPLKRQPKKIIIPAVCLRYSQF